MLDKSCQQCAYFDKIEICSKLNARIKPDMFKKLAAQCTKFELRVETQEEKTRAEQYQYAFSLNQNYPNIGLDFDWWNLLNTPCMVIDYNGLGKMSTYRKPLDPSCFLLRMKLLDFYFGPEIFLLR